VPKASPKASSRHLDTLLAEKSLVLSKAQALTTIGLSETAQTLWVSAASYEERIASLLDAYGQEREAAVHRISAASCYHKAGDASRATNLYRAALAGPLRPNTRKDTEAMLAQCLAQLAASPSIGAADRTQGR
jgi:hypothetical protein